MIRCILDSKIEVPCHKNSIMVSIKQNPPQIKQNRKVLNMWYMMLQRLANWLVGWIDG